MDNLLRIKNGQSIARQQIPRLSFQRFSRVLSDFVHYDGYIVQLFAYVEGCLL